jgi:imidazolonepropionase-like amidohydrolase
MGPRLALTNVRVFDGWQLQPPGTVVIDGSRIGTDAAGAEVIDGEGGILLPGLIDAHVHLKDRDTLGQLAAAGVTTALDMACAPPGLVASLRGVAGLTDIRSAGTPAIAPGSLHASFPVIGRYGVIFGADQAAGFVADRVAEGSDYIKIVVGSPGADHDQATLDALTAAAREHGRLSVAHAASYQAVEKAQRAGVSVLTHVPLDRALDEAAAARARADDRVLIPTLVMMEGLARAAVRPGMDYGAARTSVTVMYRAGVPILAGTDANDTGAGNTGAGNTGAGNTGAGNTGGPIPVPHGSSLHHELELLVDAGLTTVDALRAATTRPARYFGLADRGVVEPGRRADLVLVDGDPLHDIKATQAIRRVWCAGTEVIPGAGRQP